MKAAKKKWTEKQCGNIDKGIMAGNGNGKEPYNTLKTHRISQQ